MNMDINMQAPTEAGIRNRECNMSHTADVRWLHLLSHVEVAHCRYIFNRWRRYFYLALPRKAKTMVTVLENPVDEPLNISLSVTDGTWEKYIIQPKQQLIIRTNISHLKNKMKVTLKGDRRTILLKTIIKQTQK